MWRAPIDVQLGGPILQSSSDVPAIEPTPQTGFLENLKATRDEMRLAGNTNAATENERAAYAPLVDALSGELFGEGEYLGRRYKRFLLNPADLPGEEQASPYGPVPSSPAMKRAIFDAIRRRRASDPKFLAGVPDTFEAFEEQVRQRNSAKLQRIRQTQAGATGLGQVGGFVGGVLGSLEDPFNLYTLPFGGAAKTFGGAVARSAVENMLVETLSVPFAARNYRELGEDFTAADAVRSVLFAGGLGGAFGGAGHAVRKFGDIRDHVAEHLFEAMPESVRERWAKAATVDDRLLADTLRATVPEEQWTAELRSAVNVLERDAEIAEASPFERSAEGDEAHGDGLAAALQALLDADRPKPGLMSSVSPIAVPAARQAPRPAVSLSRDEIIRFTMHDLEGGAEVVNYSQADGGTTKFGIAAKFNRGVDVAGLTEDQAAAIYRERYWFPGLDRADPATAAVAFDAGVISGPAVGKRILAASGGDPERAIALYRAHLNAIADNVPGKAKYRKGWNNRVDKLARKLGLAGDGRAEAMPELAGLGETRGAGDSAAEIAELEALELSRAAADADVAARSADEAEPPFFEPVPVLKREQFASDDNWLEAQLRRSAEPQIPPEAAGNGPPARDPGSAPPDGAADAADGAQRPAGEPGSAAEPVTAESFVDAYLRGEGRGDTPRDRELQQFQVNNGPAIEAEFQRRATDAAIAGTPLSRPELEAMLATDGGRDPLWLLGSSNERERSFGREPAAAWALRDRETGEIATWSVKKGAAQKALGEQWDPGRFDLERLEPETVDSELRMRFARQQADAADLASPALERFSDPDGEGARSQSETLEHDARMEAAAELAGEQLVARNRERPRQTGLRGAAARPIATFTQDPGQVRKKGQRKRNYYLPVTEHADHAAAKAGDLDAAERLVDDLVRPEQLELAARELAGARFVPVVAEEAGGRNTIPYALADRYAAAAGGTIETEIVQAERAFHTGAGPAERVIRRARFDGPVVPGERYVLVDDVAAMGGSIAELADHIQRGGGKIERVVLLASGVDDFAPTPKQLRAIEDGGYAEHFRTLAGIEPQALTRAEAEWALGRSAERVRDQLAEAVVAGYGRRARPSPRGEEGPGGLTEDAADERRTYRLNEEGPEQTLAEILDEIDADDAAVEALRACLKPDRGAQ